MEKRNFVTSVRTPDGRDICDSLAEDASCLFGSGTSTTAKKASSSEFEKFASSEDEKTDKVSL